VVKYPAILILLIASVLLCSVSISSAQQTTVEKYIAFRDDDEKPFMPLGALDALKAVNQVHIDENVPVTLAIIPHPREAQEGNQLLQDNQFLTYMRSVAPNPLFEFAQHGYTHTPNRLSVAPSEFSGRSYDDQYNRILKGRADLIEAFGVVPKTFIPPFDKGDNNTVLAASALGFTEYSSYSTSYVQHGYINGMRIDGGIEIENGNDTTFTKSIQRAENISEQFLNDPQSDDLLVVTYHYWEFQDANGAVDHNRIQQLTNFVEFLKSRGTVFTRLDRAYTSASNTSPPATASLAVIIQPASTIYLLVGSVSVVLLGIYVNARRQRQTSRRTK
jgi:peptidoglycan/xylan/chitin deacetylase (PgdA/CDA1 family)